MPEQLCLGPGAVDEEVCGSRKKFSKREGGAKGQMRLLRARGSVEFRKVAFGYARQGLWLEDRKVGSQAFGKD